MRGIRRASPIASALAVIAERLGDLSTEDRADLVEMANLFFGHPDAEERDAAQRAIAEILDPPDGRLLSLDEWRESAPTDASGSPSG